MHPSMTFPALQRPTVFAAPATQLGVGMSQGRVAVVLGTGLERLAYFLESPEELAFLCSQLQHIAQEVWP